MIVQNVFHCNTDIDSSTYGMHVHRSVTAAMAVQYREDTAGTSGATNFSGVHKEAVQPEASVLMPASPLQMLLKYLVPQSPRGLARETRARKIKIKYRMPHRVLVQIDG